MLERNVFNARDTTYMFLHKMMLKIYIGINGRFSCSCQCVYLEKVPRYVGSDRNSYDLFQTY